MLAPAFGAPQATSAASLAKKLARTLTIAKRADRNAKRAIAGLQVEGAPGKAGANGPAGAKGAEGEQGLQGEHGTPGTPGTPATRLWAVVGSNGTLSRGSSAVSASRDSAGTYRVIFDRAINACAYIGNLSTTIRASRSRASSA
jgi:hypothetical protein